MMEYPNCAHPHPSQNVENLMMQLSHSQHASYSMDASVESKNGACDSY